jgi:threonine 3-dehydrogenase
VSRPGAFAEYLALPAANVFAVPDHISDDVAAVLDPLGNATHTALAFDVVGEDVLITGAGPIGLMAAAIVRHVGARLVAITDVNDYRLELAARMGVDRVVDVRTTGLGEVMAGLGMTEGFDVGLEMSGNESALNQMLEAMNHGGRVALLGIPAGDVRLDVAEVIFKGLTMRGIYGRRIFETWYKMAAMLQTGLDVEAVITHRFPADEFEAAFDLVRSGHSGKVLLEW